MIALCVDDEALLLGGIKRAVEKSPDISDVFAFDDEYDALDWAKDNSFDIAFLDIQLHDMNGLELAEKLKALHPMISIVFCTGYDEYAIDAFRLHAQGYLMKPVRDDAVQTEIDVLKMKRVMMANKPLTVRVYGGFEAYDKNGKVLRFHRSISKNLLAILVDRNGLSLTARELIGILWGEDPSLEEQNYDYLKKILADLRSTLKEIDAGDAIVRAVDGYAINMNLVSVDIYGKANGLEYMKGMKL